MLHTNICCGNRISALFDILAIIFSCNRNIDDVDKTMDEINEQTENMKQIQEALSTPIGASADFDEVVALLMLSQFLLVLIGLPPHHHKRKEVMFFCLCITII